MYPFFFFSSEKVRSPKAAVSARYQVAMEFLQTEKNYVGILQTILNVSSIFMAVCNCM